LLKRSGSIPVTYADKRASFEKQEFTEKEYNEELERIHTKLLL